MRKFYLLFALLISFSSAAWADFDLAWTNAPSPWSSTAATDVPEGVVTTTSGTKHVGISRHVVKSGEAGDVSVTFEYKSGAHALRILGVDLVNAEGTIVKSAYEEGTVGSAPNNTKTYTLSNVDPGTYSLRYWVCNVSNSNEIGKTNGVITVAGLDRVYITSLSELKNDKIYTIKSGRSGETSPHYLLYHTAATENLSSTYGSGHAMGYSDDATNFQFAIYKSGDAYYMYNIAANKFVGNANDNNATIPMVKVPSNAVYFKASEVEGYNWMLSTNNFVGALNAAGVADKHGLVNWTGGNNNTTDGGNVYQIMEVGDLSAEKQTYISNMIAWGPKYWEAYNLSAVSTDETVMVGELSVEAGYNIGLACSTFFFTPNETNYNTLVSTLEANNIDANKVTLSVGETFKIKCIESSRGYLAYSTVAEKGSETKAWLAETGNENHPSLTDEGAYTDFALIEILGKKYIYNIQNKKFILRGTPVTFAEIGSYVDLIEEAHNSATQFNIKFDGEAQYLSFSPGWGANSPVRTEGSIDNGCRFYLVKTGENVASDILEVMNKKAAKIGLDITLAKGRLLGTGVSKYTYNGSGDATGTIETAEALLTNGTATTEQINASISALNAIYEDFSLNMPEVGKLYRFRGYASKKYMAPSAATTATNDDTKMDMNSNSELPATIFMLREGDQVNGETGYKLLNYSTGYYTKKTHNLGAMASAANSMTIKEATSGNPGCYMMQTNSSGIGTWIFDNYSKVDRYEVYKAGNCDWTMEEVTWLPIPVNTTYGIGTLYSPVNLAETNVYYGKDTRLKFYIGSIEEDYLVLTKLEGNIPAETPVLFEYQSGSQIKNDCSYMAIAASAEAVTAKNDLRGTLETINKPSGTIYTLQPATPDATELTFCLYTGDTLKGGKAYLPAASAVKGIRYNTGESTGIEAIATEKASKEIFDLSGRRVQNPTSGLYIINGQKVYVK